MLVKYLQVYHDKNPSSSVVVQADQNNRFYRVFVSIPSSALVFKTLCIPFYFIDGTFHKTANYDGVLIQLCGKHGFGGSLRLCSAWVPTESAAHFAFFVLTMKNSGFDIENVPFMSDRGHLLADGRLLNTVCGITISVKYCMEHIIRNTIGKFHIKKSAIPLLRKVISAMQGSDTFEKFLTNTHDLADKFEDFGKEIAVYIMRIHPRHWTVFGNLETIPDTYWIDNYATLLRVFFDRCGIMDTCDLDKLKNADLFFNNISIG